MLTDKDIYCMGRAEYLSETLGISLAEASEIALKEWNEKQD